MRKIGGIKSPDRGIDGLSPAGRGQGYAERFPYTQEFGQRSVLSHKPKGHKMERFQEAVAEADGCMSSDKETIHEYHA
jgi:hypothetical protein